MIRQKRKQVKSVAECHVVQIQMNPPLTNLHLNSIFPPTVSCVLETKGRRIYDARMSKSRTTETVSR